jgi:hypothetical protein
MLVQPTPCPERHLSGNQCKKRVILAQANIGSCMELRSSLPNDDGPSRDKFTTKCLHTQHLWLRIPSIARRAAAFFLCHFSFPSNGDYSDLQFRELLPMTLPLLVMLAPPHFEDANLVMQPVCHDSGLHQSAVNPGRPNLHRIALANGQHLVNDDFLTNIGINKLYFDFLASSNAILLST